MLVGDLVTYQVKSEQSGGSPHCRLCPDMKSETISHILTFCSQYSELRIRILEEYSYLCMQSESGVDFAHIMSDSEKLCQFILDPTSLNLESRISVNDPMVNLFFQTSRDLCFSINKKRLKLIKSKQQEQTDGSS